MATDVQSVVLRCFKQHAFAAAVDLSPIIRLNFNIAGLADMHIVGRLGCYKFVLVLCSFCDTFRTKESASLKVVAVNNVDSMVVSH